MGAGVNWAWLPRLRARVAFRCTLALIAVTAVSIAYDRALANTACSVSGGTITCSGNQSAGVSYINSGTVSEVDLGSLTTSLAPASGQSAVALQLSPANGNSGSLTIKADATLNAATQNADGLFVQSAAGLGSAGSGGTFTSENGGNGGTGGISGNVTVTNAGVIAVQEQWLQRY